MKANENLQALMQEWLINNKRKQVSGVTFEKLMGMAKRHIYPHLGHLKLQDISTETITQLFADSYKNKNLNYASLNKCRQLINGFFVYCVNEKYIAENPVEKADITINAEDKAKQRSYHVLKVEDRQRFIEAVSYNRFWKPFCLTILQTGMKIGEALALKWRNLNFTNRTISIETVVAPKTNFDSLGNVTDKTYCIKEIQNPYAKRILPMTDNIYKLLVEYRIHREKEQRQVRNKYSYVTPEDLVFGNDKSELFSYSGISHDLSKFLKKQGVGDLNVTFTMLRHTFIEKMLEAQEQLSSVRIFIGCKSAGHIAKSTYLDNCVLDDETADTYNEPKTQKSGSEM